MDINGNPENKSENKIVTLGMIQHPSGIMIPMVLEGGLKHYLEHVKKVNKYNRLKRLGYNKNISIINCVRLNSGIVELCVNYMNNILSLSDDILEKIVYTMCPTLENDFRKILSILNIDDTPDCITKLIKASYEIKELYNLRDILELLAWEVCVPPYTHTEFIDIYLDSPAFPTLDSTHIKNCLDSDNWQESLEAYYIVNNKKFDIVLSDGTSILSQALDSGKENIVKWLLKKGVDPNIPLLSKHTPLAIAIGNKNIKMIELLIMYGANRHITEVSILKNKRAGKKLITLLSMDIKDFIASSKYKEILTYIGRLHKISSANLNKLSIVRDELKNNFKNWDELVDKRKKKFSHIPGGNTNFCHDTVLTGDNIWEYDISELYIYPPVGSENKRYHSALEASGRYPPLGSESKRCNTYCFHMSELPTIIYNKKNPYTNEPIPENIIKDMVDKLDYIPAITLKEAVDLEKIPIR